MGQLSESAFLELADETLEALDGAFEAAADQSGADIETTRKGGILEVEFADRSKIIINSQAPMREIWVAAKSGGFHFRWDGPEAPGGIDDGTWVDTRDGGELFAALSRLAGQQAGIPLQLA
ncbi:MAG: iron donor protein CyaY [Candidatus Protistobacter heckmanni]|nr:iron donor protein CyaY [Candidatus Protistobacter heckmanni]